MLIAFNSTDHAVNIYDESLQMRIDKVNSNKITKKFDD